MSCPSSPLDLVVLNRTARLLSKGWSFIAPPTLYRGVVKNGDVEFSVVHTASVEGWKEADFVQKQVCPPLPLQL